MAPDINKITYFDGFNDGAHSCFGALSALIDGVNQVDDPNQIKMMIATTANTIADIMETTSKKLEELMKKED
jgi:hypothetical protein